MCWRQLDTLIRQLHATQNLCLPICDFLYKNSVNTFLVFLVACTGTSRTQFLLAPSPLMYSAHCFAPYWDCPVAAEWKTIRMRIELDLLSKHACRRHRLGLHVVSEHTTPIYSIQLQNVSRICSSRCVIICNIKLFSLTHFFFIVWYSDHATCFGLKDHHQDLILIWHRSKLLFE
jgi:hypothetical protein